MKCQNCYTHDATRQNDDGESRCDQCYTNCDFCEKEESVVIGDGEFEISYTADRNSNHNALLDVTVITNFDSGHTITLELPIKFCPMCGKEL